METNPSGWSKSEISNDNTTVKKDDKEEWGTGGVLRCLCPRHENMWNCGVKTLVIRNFSRS
jgi:hypothetical protein